MKKIVFATLAMAAMVSCKEVNKKSQNMEANTAPVEITEAEKKTATAHIFQLTNIDGKPFSLKEYAGKKILVVNTASACGYTRQYTGLQKLQDEYKDKLVVVGFPCNDFGGQEPGTEAEIKDFCKKNHGVTFPLSEKIAVKGESTAPLFKWLTTKAQNGVLDATIKWNFNKFLLNEKGELISYFPSNTEPMDAAIVGLL